MIVIAIADQERLELNNTLEFYDIEKPLLEITEVKVLMVAGGGLEPPTFWL